jgi:hypothetical protein
MDEASLLNAAIDGARSALGIGWWWAVWSAYDYALQKGAKLTGSIHGSLMPAKSASFESARRRFELAGDLFLSSSKPTEFLPPADWSGGPPDVQLSDGTKTYGHEFEVLKAVAAFLSTEPVTWDVRRQFWPAHSGCSQVMLASGSSNRASRVVIGTPEDPIFHPKLGESRPKLAYSIGTGTGTLKRLQYGKEIERTALAVCDETGRAVLQAEHSSGYQVGDYLLVTRVPGPVPGTVFTVLSGLHGPGTRSAELLFRTVPPAVLEDLASRIDYRRGEIPYFQAVFRGSQFGEQFGSSVATKTELVTEGCPPVRLE